MLKFLDEIPYIILIFLSVFMLLAPFRPQPHVLEKLTMIANGTLRRPIDIFDLVYHMAPVVLLTIKFARSLGDRPRARGEQVDD